MIQYIDWHTAAAVTCCAKVHFLASPIQLDLLAAIGCLPFKSLVHMQVATMDAAMHSQHLADVRDLLQEDAVQSQ